MGTGNGGRMSFRPVKDQRDPNRRHNCACGNVAHRKVASAWECDECSRKNEVAFEILRKACLYANPYRNPHIP